MRLRYAVPVLVLAFASAMPASAAAPPPGASSCSGCHPANRDATTPVPRLAGRDPAEILQLFQAYRSGERPATVMGRIAKGFTDDEVKAIADWYRTQSN
jgi:cytochrome c553